MRPATALGFELLGTGLHVIPDYIRDLVRNAVVIGIDRVAQRGDLLQLFLPQRKEAALKL